MDEALLHDTILRISKMELCFDRLREASETNPAALKEDPILKEHLHTLTRYYEGGQWLCDYALDEQGLLPHDLKRGVLSQDALFNFLDSLNYRLSGGEQQKSDGI